ncbi:MAG TPA: thermonuclease family protein [Kamptonema sp.]|nr:thermonuclease family protein [Kamptonema sp.]
MSELKIVNSQVMKRLSMLALILLLVGCQQTAETNNYAVKRVSDGDTLTLTDTKGKDIKVRFACVDAPEVPHSQKERQSTKIVDKDQFMWGLKAQQRIQQLINKGGDRVLLTITDTDQYGRKISEVRLRDGTFVQEVLLREGLAMVYRPYLKNCPSADIVQKVEAEAKKSRRGVWGDAKFVPAWEFRRNSK